MVDEWQPDESIRKETDAAMQTWRQGFIVQKGHGAWVSDRDNPLTEATATLGGEGQGVTVVSNEYLVVVTQTCDIVKPCWAPPSDGGGHPFVQVSPVVNLEGKSLENASRGRMPRYAHLPGLGSNCFADLNQCTTIEKTVLARIGFLQDGCPDEKGRANFAAALAEHRSRFAFPNGMEKAIGKLRKRFDDKWDGEGKETPLIKDVCEVRVKPLTKWDSEEIKVELIFIVEPSSLPSRDPCADEPVMGDALRDWASTHREVKQIVERLTDTGNPDERGYLWQMLAQEWANLGDQSGRVRIVGGEAMNSTEYTVQRMWSEPKLSFDHLSADD